jgi:NAD-dependent deacetylase
MNAGIKELFDLITGARCCTAFTGAGISTLSGISDFRGRDGLFTGPGGEDPPASGPVPEPLPAEAFFNIEYFEKDPSLFYAFAASRIYTVDKKEPSVVHRVLAELENRGLLKAVITQNIDMLHQKAGSRKVIELHGSPRFHYCLFCPGIRVRYAEAAAALRDGSLPRCPQCGRVLKPALTFYGESLPLDARRQAEEAAQKAGLLLILGTSLTVNPAAELPRTTLRNGGSLIIVNETPTPLDRLARLRLSSLEAVFRGLETLLNNKAKQ